MADTGNEFTTTIGPDAKFEGKLIFERGLKLQGQLNGEISTAGRLHVTKEARMDAKVDAGSIVIEGNVKGDLNAGEKIELKNSAQYEGNLTASKLVVEEGARFVGQVSVGPDVPKPRPAGSPGIARPAGQGMPQGATAPKA